MKGKIVALKPDYLESYPNSATIAMWPQKHNLTSQSLITLAL